MEIGSVLRESRLNAKMSVDQVSKILTAQGYKASQKTVYSWENGNSRPDIEILMKLCDIYGIKDILRTFGYNGYKEDGSIQLNMRESDLVETYRALDPPGQSHVDAILQWETERVKQFEQAASAPAATRIINYYYRLASAGTGQIIFDMPPTKRIEIPAIPEYEKADYAIGVNGNSMEPVYHDGDTLLVEMTDSVEIGEIGIFLVNGESFVKKRGESELISLNLGSKNVPLNEDARCLGKVIGKLPNA